VGELVDLGYLTHGPLGGGDPRPLPRGGWVREDLSRVSDYRPTPEGRAEADRVRRQTREARTDAVLGPVLPLVLQPWMNDAQRQSGHWGGRSTSFSS
jgi:hypothetical protein